MQHFQSIRMRILGGFLAVFILQVGVSLAVWRAEGRADQVASSAAVSDAAIRQLPLLTEALQATQLRLAEFLRVGGVAERAAVTGAVSAMDQRTAALVSGRNDGAALSVATGEMGAAIRQTMAAVTRKRDAGAAIELIATKAQNAASALAQAASLADGTAVMQAAFDVAAATALPFNAGTRYLLTEDRRHRSVAHEAVGFTQEALHILQGTTQPDGAPLPERVTRLSGKLGEALAALDPALDAAGAAIAARTSELAAMNAAFGKAAAAITAAAQQNEAELGRLNEQNASARDEVRMTVVAGAVLNCVLGQILALLVARSITRPVGRLSTAMRQIADGSLDHDVPDQARQDEVGAMATALLDLRDSSRRARVLEAEAEVHRGRAKGERMAAEAKRTEEASEQALVVEGLADGLARLAKGDLTCQLNRAFSAQYERLRADFNAAMSELQATMTVIVSSTGGIRSGADEITHSADDLCRRTEQQAASLEETAAALDEITATVRRTSEGANAARNSVSTATADAKLSGDIVRDAVAAMSAIESSAEQIGQIIGVIDEIAFQTNLLALNAGVEAARAGDAGRGFAVVASEVRALAQRSAEAAKEIKALISKSSKQVARGVELVAQTGTALERIVVQVGQINGVVGDIAASAQEQATGLQQINTAINQMDQMTQQNAAMVEQSTAASHALAQESEELMRLTARFQLGTPQGKPVLRRVG